jgi:hypothetical protein
MNERLIHLRIKIKSLADEARTIRQEAKKTSGMVKWGLNAHRTGTVRHHTRHNLLAYGLLRGTPYEIMEKKCHEAPDFNAVTQHAKRFGGTDEVITSWIEEAKAHLVPQRQAA